MEIPDGKALWGAGREPVNAEVEKASLGFGFAAFSYSKSAGAGASLDRIELGGSSLVI